MRGTRQRAEDMGSGVWNACKAAVEDDAAVDRERKGGGARDSEGLRSYSDASNPCFPPPPLPLLPPLRSELAKAVQGRARAERELAKLHLASSSVRLGSVGVQRQGLTLQEVRGGRGGHAVLGRRGEGWGCCSV